MNKRFRIGVIGFGRMGRGFVAAMQESPVWDVAYICDADPAMRDLARKTVPSAKIVADPDAIFHDKTLDVAGLFTLADARPGQLRRAMKAGLHVIAEKPLGADIKTEWELVKEIEASDKLVAVNIFNRNAWYHRDIINFIDEGQIGELAIVRVCHMTPGHMPTEGHDPEGPPFHDCGMHYVDVARWYAKSEYAKWHAQGIRMWNYKDPWWVQVHGQFQNGVVFDITQGFVYGHMAAEKTSNCYVDVIGTQGIARMSHDFVNATIDCHGTTQTIKKTAPFGDKKLDVMCEIFARSLMAGKNLGFPTARDSVIASDVSWAMLHDAVKNGPPVKGTQAEMLKILEHRSTLRNGFGLPARVEEAKTGTAPAARLVAPVACGEDLCAMPKVRKLNDACA